MLSIADAVAKIQSGSVTPSELLETCLRNIAAKDPELRAWVYVDAEGARRQVEALSRRTYRGLLHGIPIGVKDLFDVAEMPTAAGSVRWSGSIARENSTVVARLRQAGAIILGKTATTPYASFDPSPTLNPWHPGKTPGGSSSGSAAAVAAKMCFGAIASQTGGSTTRPASYCGVASLKPTWGRISLAGVVPLAPTLDHVGVMASNVTDLAILFAALAGFDSGHHHTLMEPIPALETMLAEDEPLPPLVFLRGMFESLAEPVVREMMRKVRKVLPEAIDAEPESLFADILVRHRRIMAVECAMIHHDRWSRYPEDYPPNVSQLMSEGRECPAILYAQTLRHRESDAANVRNWPFIAVVPATTSPAPNRDTTGDPAFNSPWSYLHLPTISIPVSRTAEGLPLSVQLVAGHCREAELFRAAKRLETLLKQQG